jgi:hypothetical protein
VVGIRVAFEVAAALFSERAATHYMAKARQGNCLDLFPIIAIINHLNGGFFV